MKTVPIGRAGLPKNHFRISGAMAVKVALSDGSRSAILNRAPSLSAGSSGKSIRLRPRRGNADRIRSRREIVCV